MHTRTGMAAIQAAEGNAQGSAAEQHEARQNLASQGNSPQGSGGIPQDGDTA